MTTRVVSTLDGSDWRIRRRWLPHREGAGVRARVDTHRRQRAKKRAERAGDGPHRWFDAGRLRDSLAGEFSRGLDPHPDDPLLSR